MKRHIVQDATEGPDGRRVAPAALRNAAAIVETLRQRLPKGGRILELASGTGQHAAAFAAEFPELAWIPSDIDADQRDSISAWRKESGLKNLAEPLDIDIALPWPLDRGDVQAVLAINLLHLIPSTSVSHLFREARSAMSAKGRVIIYGPFLRGTSYVSDGDRVFDAALHARDPDIGYKSVEEVSETALAAGFASVAVDKMPANNLVLTFALP